MPALAGKPTVWRIVKQAMYHLERALRLRKHEASNWTDTIEEHEALVKAIIGGDVEVAVGIISQHIDRNLVEVRKVREAYPDYFGTPRRSGRTKQALSVAM